MSVREVDAVEELFRRHRNEVYRYLARQVSADVADDLTAEVFFEASRHLARPVPTPLGIGWLMTVARRRLCDHWRRTARAATLQRRLVFEASCGIDDRGRGWPTASDGSAAPGEVPELVDLPELAGLPTRQRQALVLRYVAGHSVGEVATIIGATYQSTESLLARARRGYAGKVTSTRPAGGEPDSLLSAA